MIKEWSHRHRSVVYGPVLRRPRRWRKCKQTAENDTFYRFRWHHPLITQLSLVHIIWTERHMSKLVLNVKYSLVHNVIFFNYGQVLQFGAHSRYYKRSCDLCYFQTWFSYWLKKIKTNIQHKIHHLTFRPDFRIGWKKSKQIFNTKFINWHEPDINVDFWYIRDIRTTKIFIITEYIS